MKRKSNAKKVLNVLASRVSLLVLGSITVWMGYMAAQEMHARYKVKREIERLKEEIMSLEEKNSDLSSLLGSFEDSAVVELEAKKRLNLKKPGEEVAVIVREGEEAEQNIGSVNEPIAVKEDNLSNMEEKEVPNPVKWWKYLME